MATASYQSNNDYNLVNGIRPFNLPYESTMQEIATKTQYWKVGADRVKSVYDQASGLDPQFTQNKEYLKNFMNEANQKLQKLNKADLSVFDNSQEVVNIFKPLYDTTNKFNYRLLADSQLNKFYQKQEQIANTYRTKDGGKEWNQNNEFYFRDAQQKYLEDAKNGKIDNIESHYQNKKAYIPYYDFKKEVLDIQEACKGYSYDRKGLAGNNDMYFQQEFKSGCTPTELAAALKTGLSDRARQQAMIDGYVHFKGNEDTLIKKFVDINITEPQEEIDNLKATIDGITDKKTKKAIAGKEKQYEFYTSRLKELEQDFKDSKIEYDNMVKGNPSEYVRNNYEKLAGQIYYRDLTSNLAIAFRTDSEKNIVSPNPAGMLRFRLETERANMYIQNTFDQQNSYIEHLYRKDEENQKFEHDKELKASSNGKSGKASDPNFTGVATPVTTENQSEIKITEQEFKEKTLIPAKRKLDDAYAVINDYVSKARGTNKSQTNQEIINYVTGIEDKQKNNQVLTDNEKDVLEAYGRYKEAQYELAFYNDKMASIDAIVKRDNQGLYDEKKYDDSKKSVGNFSMYIPIVGKGQYPHEVIQQANVNTGLSEKDFLHMLKGKNVNGFTIEKKDEYFYNDDGTVRVQHKEPEREIRLYYNGRQVDLSSNPILKKLFNSANKKSKADLDEINNQKTKLYTKYEYENSNKTIFNPSDVAEDGSDFKKQFDENIKGILGGLSGGLNDKNGYTIVARDKTGEGIYVKLLDNNNEPINASSKIGQAILASLRKGTRGSEVTSEKDVYYIPNVLPRYPGLPAGETLGKVDKLKEHIKDIETVINNTPDLLSKPVLDSRELLTGGTSRYVSNATGMEYIISISKERGHPTKYVATYSHSKLGEQKLVAYTIDNLLAKIETK